MCLVVYHDLTYKDPTDPSVGGMAPPFLCHPFTGVVTLGYLLKFDEESNKY